MTTPDLPISEESAARANFDRVASLYRWAEYLLLGSLLTRVRNFFLPELARCRTVLLLGDGDGRFAARLLRQAPEATALAIDSSVAMLKLLRARCAFAGDRLTTVPSSVSQLPNTTDFSSVDLIITHFLLDCLSQAQVEDLTRQLGTRVAPGCLWIVSDFAIPARQPWRFLGRLYVDLLYKAFRVLTRLPVQALPRTDSALQRAGFHLVAQAEFVKGLLYTQLWRLGSETGNRATGATSPAPSSSTYV